MPVSYEVRDRVAVLKFDDGKANVFSHESIAAFTDALDRARTDSSAGAVLVVGRPGRFSSGFDLATMRSGDEPMRALVKAGGEFTARLLLFPKPVVVACTGHALAAGALVLLAADHRIGAAGEFKIGLNEVAIGLTMPRWGVELARYRLRPSDLDWRLVLGQTAAPEEAVAAGFLDRVVPAADLDTAAMEAAVGLASLPTRAVAGTKRAVRAAVVEAMLQGIDEDLAGVTMGS